MSRAQILAIGVDKVTMEQAVARCLAFIESGTPHMVVTPNAEIAYAASQNPELAHILNQADLVIPDGIGVVMASRLLGDAVPEKVAGADLSTRLVAEMAERGMHAYLLGARPEVVAEAARRLMDRYPGLNVAYRDGYFAAADEPAILAEIERHQPAVLFVGMGSPRQEQWLSNHLQQLGVPLCIGVGGTIDVWAGAARRAPDWMLRANLEWLYRMVRFGRYGRVLPPLIKFLWRVGIQRMRGNHAHRDVQ